ncbi:hypothetical protein L6164_000476 [Bauhinia variegata]|uniref:Uncharacterized protein n=1 Tax=Bauhinia variegata TaxID=167791 RepID=A0ACB9Q827_BAUVA|nr:hypothetical protein L6164_000476 [Bauhinia variegata]
MWPLLTMDDFKCRFIDPNWSPFEMLLEIAEVEEQKFQQDQRSSHEKIHVGVDVTAKPKKEKKAEPNPVRVNGVAVAEADNAGKNPRRGWKFNNASKKNIYDHRGVTGEADSRNSEPNPVAEISKEHVCEERFLCLEKKPNNETIGNPNPDDNNGKKPLVLKLKRRVADDDECMVFNSKKAEMESTPRTSNSNPILNRQFQLPTPPLAKEFMKKINELGGTEITFLIQKALFPTDLSQQHNRLSMPIKQMKSDEFLRESELHLVESKENKNKDHVLNVPLLQPSSLEVWESGITLKRWDMSGIYALIGSWFRMVMANGLEENDIIQVWSFRVQGQLWMALVKLN